MNCPKDNTSMEKGFDNAGFWVNGDQPTMSHLQFVPGRKSKFMTAWRCPKCGKVELVTDPD